MGSKLGYGWEEYELIATGQRTHQPTKEKNCDHGILISWSCAEYEGRFDEARGHAQ